MSLAGVFNHDQVVSFGQLKDGIHVGCLTVQMHRDDRGHGLPGFLADQSPCRAIEVASGFQVGLKFLGIHIVRALINIDEFR